MKLLKYLCILGWGWLVLEAWLSIDQPADCHCCDFDACCGWELATFALTALYFFWSGIRGRSFGRWLCGVCWGLTALSHAASCVMKFRGTWLDNRLDCGTVMAWTLVLAFVVTGLWGLGRAACAPDRWRWARRLALGGGTFLWMLVAFSNGRYQFYAFSDWEVAEAIATMLLFGVGILLSVPWRWLATALFASVHFVLRVCAWSVGRRDGIMGGIRKKRKERSAS